MIKTGWQRRGRYSAEEVLTALYRGALGREPDEGGLANITGHLQAGVPLSEVIAHFIRSPEYTFKKAAVVSAEHLDTLPANQIQLDLSPAERRDLWEHVVRVWSRLGNEKPYRSVLTSMDIGADEISAKQLDEFYQSGRAEIERLLNYLARHHRTLPADAIAVDYGCGVGRATLWLARHCRKVLAVDVSEPHLAIARNNLVARGVTNVEFHLVRDASDLGVLNDVDLFHSDIVLQHNPPPLILEILSRTFSGLRTGGYAFFQVPTYCVDYHWDLQAYLDRMMPQQAMEMHLLPQSVIFDAAARAGCVPLEVEPDGSTGMAHGISNTFLFTKSWPSLAAPSSALNAPSRIDAAVTD